MPGYKGRCAVPDFISITIGLPPSELPACLQFAVPVGFAFKSVGAPWYLALRQRRKSLPYAAGYLLCGNMVQGFYAASLAKGNIKALDLNDGDVDTGRILHSVYCHRSIRRVVGM